MKASWTPGIVLFFFLSAAISCCAGDPGAEAPRLEASSFSGALDTNRPSTIAVVLHNNASLSVETDELDLNPASARDIVAELERDDDRIRVLSGPQMAGSLAPGENKTVEFMALAEGAEVGIYPMQLRLTYSRLSGVAASGDDSAPDIVFDYEGISQELALPVKVVRGPEIELKELKGEAVQGRDSSLELVIVNSGDEPAIDLRLEARSMPPFLRVENEKGRAEEVNLYPGGSTSVKLAVFTDANATQGYSPLPCKISYLDSSQGDRRDPVDQKNRRGQDLAVLVMVHNEAYPVTWQLSLAGLLLLLLAGAYLGLKRLRSQGKKKKPRRILRG